MTYKRNCPDCGSEIEYTNKRSWYNAKRRNSSCKSCANLKISETAKRKIKNGEKWGGDRSAEREINMDRPYKRNCPMCGEEMEYVSKYKRDKSEENEVVCNSCSAIKYEKGIAFRKSTNDEIKKMRASKAGYDSWEEYVEKYPEKEMYRREVWKYTYRNDLELLDNWEKRGRCGVDGAFQLDHIISIQEGYENNISPDKIGSMDNLRMIPWKENREKW